jgi:hypothetical protein
MTRLQDFYDHYRNNDITEYELMCGLQNGEIDSPEWLSYNAIDTDSIEIFDNEEPDYQRILLSDDRVYQQ